MEDDTEMSTAEHHSQKSTVRTADSTFIVAVLAVLVSLDRPNSVQLLCVVTVSVLALSQTGKGGG